MSTKETIPVPFPVDEDPAHTVDVFSGYWKGMDELYGRAQVEEVKLDDLVASQEAVDLPYVKKLLKAKKYNDPKRILILRMPDKTLKIDDGHHTLTAAKLAGLQTVKALVADVLPEELVKNNMKPSLKELASLLVEQALSEDDAPANAPFGQWLFGKDQTNKKANDEWDTEIEKTFGKLLHRHYDGSGDNSKLGQIFLKYVKPQLRKGNYVKYLAPPNTTVYRGMSMSIKEFSQLVKMDETELTDVKDVGRGWYLAHQGKLVPLKSITNTMHWSTDHKQATGFAGGTDAESRNIFVVFSANTAHPKNNFFVNPQEALGGFNKGSSPLTLYPTEKEVISVGPVNFDEISFYISSDSDRPPKVADEEAEVYLEKIRKYLYKILPAKNYQTKITNYLLSGDPIKQTYKREIVDVIYSLFSNKEVKSILGDVRISGNMDIYYTTNVHSSAKIIDNFIHKSAVKQIPTVKTKEQLKQHILDYVIMDAINNLRKIGFTHTVMKQDPEEALLYSMGFTKKEPKLRKSYGY